MAPDVFNYMFDNPALQQTLVMGTHYQSTLVWDAARLPTGKALAFGFVSHNELFGADPSGPPGAGSGLPQRICDCEGHDSARHAGRIPGGVFGAILYLNEITKDPDVQLTICHTLTEFGLDVMMKQVDPRIGQKMASAALLPQPGTAPSVGQSLRRCFPG